MTAPTSTTSAWFTERLAPPVTYWLVGMFVAVSFVTAVAFYLGPEFAVVGGLIVAAGVAVTLLWLGETVIRVDAAGLRVGRSLLEWDYVGGSKRLDADAARDRLGPAADVRAHVVARPWIATAVEIAVEDAADPHPYWIVSTRRPAALDAALARGRGEAR